MRHILLINSLAQWATNINILSNCSEVINLYVAGPVDFDLLPFLKLRKLSLSLPAAASEWCHSTLHRPLFLSVTHLELFQEEEDGAALPSWQEWSQLASLPALTHLCLSNRFPSEILTEALAKCPRLLLGVTAYWSIWSRDAAIARAQSLTTTDPRVVVMVVRDYHLDWGAGAHGGDDFWVRAERFVARKKMGEIDSAYAACQFSFRDLFYLGSCYFLDEPDPTS